MGEESNERPERLAPLAEDEWSDRQREVLAPLLVGPTRNIYTTLVRAPDLAEAMTTLGRTLRDGGIPLRHRETLILRTGWNCQSNYEFAQHRRVANHGGMTDADVQRIVDGPAASGWDPFEQTLCRLADELHEHQQVGDDTWNALAAEYDDAQLIQAVLLVGYYHLVSFSLNAFGTPLEPGAVGFED
ncbi:MAG: carboxymuconolactone decarboxylase family protein [Acidimicrobiia bacterium]